MTETITAPQTAPSVAPTESIRPNLGGGPIAGRRHVAVECEKRGRLSPLRYPTSGQNIRDLLLVGLTVASGAVDAISYFGLHKTFSAFMTGNMVFLGFGIANLRGPAVVLTVCALSAFAAGAYVGLRIAALRPQESGLWPRRMSVLLTLVAIAEAGFVAVWWATTGHPSPGVTEILTALFSVAMGIQTAAARSLDVGGVFTTAGTFTLVAFAGTLAGTRTSAERSRLAGVLVGLVAGVVGGGLLFLHARHYAPVLPLAATTFVILAGRSMQTVHSPATPGTRPASMSVEDQCAQPQPHREELQR
jgi:uncharacterized membrane protein YoaK (UPF0700 family)